MAITFDPGFLKGELVKLTCDVNGPSYTVIGYVLAGDPLVTQYIICGFDGLEFTKYRYELVQASTLL